MEYIIDGILPAYQVHLFAGASGSGKTDFLLQHLRDFQDGKPFFGHKVHPCPVGYIIADRSLEECEEKFVLRQIPPFPLHSLIDNQSFHPKDIAKAGRRISTLKLLLDSLRAERPEISLLVLDTIAGFLTPKINDYYEVADALTDLNRFCRTEKVTILGAHHATKLKPDTTFTRAQDRILGSAALLGYSGTHIFLTSPQETGTPSYTLTLIPHNHPPIIIELVRNSIGKFELVESAQAVADKMMTKDSLIIPPTPSSISVLESLNPSLSRPTLFRKLKEAVSSGIATKTGHGLYHTTP